MLLSSSAHFSAQSLEVVAEPLKQIGWGNQEAKCLGIIGSAVMSNE